jgi:hypothetical protein
METHKNNILKIRRDELLLLLVIKTSNEKDK